MFSPVSDLVRDNAAVQAVFGNPARIDSFGNSPQDGAKPYAVHQVVGGSPENYLAGLPDLDSLIVQVDVYARAPQDTKRGVEALVGALEPVAYVTSWNGEFFEPDTKLYRISFTVEFITPR